MTRGLDERTQVVAPLGVVVGVVGSATLAVCLAFGSWLWALQAQLGDLRIDVAVVKAAVLPLVASMPPPVFLQPAPEWPAPAPPPALPSPPPTIAVDPTLNRREGMRR